MFSPRIQAVIDRVDRLREEVDDHWQIPRDEALVLAQIVRAARCRSIVEIGTSYGFSTLHLAAAAAGHGGQVHTIDRDPKKTAAATANLREADLLDVVTLYRGDALVVLGEIAPAEPIDFLFIDAAKSECDAYLDAALPKLGERGMIVTDNTLTHADQLAPFVARLRGLPGFASAAVPVGNGFEWTVRIG